MKKITPLFFFLLACSMSISAQIFYVSTTGKDTNNGTSKASPFATIQHAVDLMGPGDICYIRGGNYHDEIDLSGIAGSAGNPITLTNYGDEKVTLDGTISITSDWTLDEGNVYNLSSINN